MERLAILSAVTIVKALRLMIAGTLPREPQDHSQATYAPKMRKADGQIDQREIEHITGKVQADEASRRRLMEELRQTMDTDRIVRAVNNNPQLAAQVSAASLLAINVDTEAERSYLADLAAKLRLDPAVVQNLHDALGV